MKKVLRCKELKTPILPPGSFAHGEKASDNYPASGEALEAIHSGSLHRNEPYSFNLIPEEAVTVVVETGEDENSGTVSSNVTLIIG